MIGWILVGVIALDTIRRHSFDKVWKNYALSAIVWTIVGVVFMLYDYYLPAFLVAIGIGMSLARTVDKYRTRNYITIDLTDKELERFERLIKGEL